VMEVRIKYSAFCCEHIAVIAIIIDYDLDNVQEALQMQRDHAMCHKYEISHLKWPAIGELPSRSQGHHSCCYLDTSITSC